MSFLYWLEGIRCPALDRFFSAITYFGDEILFIVLALTVFWCVDKREGYYLFFIGFVGTIFNQFLKLAFRIARPWVKDPNFTIVESARAGAGGYSFPSGHTQNVVATLGGLARWNKNTALRIVCIVVAALTAFSRMYLGVHTPLDVGVSLVLALVLLFTFYPLVRWGSERPGRMYALLGGMTVLAVGFVLYANLWRFPANIDAANLAEGRKNAWSLLGALLGFCLSYPLDMHYVNFKADNAHWWQQLLKVMLGLALLLGIRAGLKALFAAVGFTALWSNAVRYFVIIVFAGLLWPMCFTRFLSKKEA